MARVFLLAPLAGLLGGCIIYDTHCKGPDCEDWYDDTGADRPDDDRPDEDRPDGDTDTDVAETLAFALTPNTAEVGASFLASLTSTGPFDFAAVTEVQVYGDVEIVASEAGEGSLELWLQVSDTATPGPVDILLVLEAGEVEFIGNALTIVPADGAADSDGDGIPDSEEDPADSDGDGIPDSDEGSGTGGSEDCE